MGGTLPIEREEIRGIYSQMADEVFGDEAALKADLPIDTTAGVPAHLSEVVDQWRDGRKSLRTTPAVNVYARELRNPPEPDVLRILVGLDAEVNVLDDIIDTKDLPTEQRVALTANAAFASLLIAEYAPADNRRDISRILREYFTALFQIPLVEAELFERIHEATTPTGRLEASREIYAYRARDIHAFARIPAVVAGVDEQTETRLLSDLRAYRARRLLFKDIHDVSRDLTDDDMTPIIALLAAHDSIEALTAEVENIYEYFEYSTTGTTRYGDVLYELEGTPDDLAGLLQERQQLVHAAAD